MAPIYQTIAYKPKLLVWNETLKTAFQNVKCALTGAAMLRHPEHHTPLTLNVDASDIAVGGILRQMVDGQLQPLAFFSRKLRKPNTVLLIVNCWRCIWPSVISATSWMGVTLKFLQIISHSRLLFQKFPMRGLPDSNANSQRFTEFTADVRHIAGKANLVADTLSRASCVP